jgi:hypothetical protein
MAKFLIHSSLSFHSTDLPCTLIWVAGAAGTTCVGSELSRGPEHRGEEHRGESDHQSVDPTAYMIGSEDRA